MYGGGMTVSLHIENLFRRRVKGSSGFSTGRNKYIGDSNLTPPVCRDEQLGGISAEDDSIAACIIYVTSYY
jgi:hypothetical protein